MRARLQLPLRLTQPVLADLLGAMEATGHHTDLQATGLAAGDPLSLLAL